MRQKPNCSSDTHQLVCRKSKPLGCVMPDANRIPRFVGTGFGDVPVPPVPSGLLTHGGGVGTPTGWTHDSTVGSVLAASNHPTPAPLRGGVTGARGNSALTKGSFTTVMSSKKLPSARRVGVAL